MTIRTLTALELRILAFEAKWEGGNVALKYAGARVELGWSAAGNEQKLQTLLRSLPRLCTMPRW